MKLGFDIHGEVVISAEDRLRHSYVAGQTGVGKSALLENMVGQLLEAGEGVAVLDPHGQLAEAVLGLIPPERAGELVYLNAADIGRPIAWNPLWNVPKHARDKTAADIVESFVHVFDLSMEKTPWVIRFLRNGSRALMDYPEGGNLLGISRMLTDAHFRERVARHCSNGVTRKFWLERFPDMERKEIERTVIALETRIEAFSASSAARNILGQTASTVDLREIMDKGKILVVNLAKGEIGAENAHLLGALLISSLAQTALSRKRPETTFNLIADEFQNFATKSFDTILSEARKYRLSLTLAHQYISQIPEQLRDAVLGNAGNVISFRVGTKDAKVLGEHIDVVPRQLTDLSNYFAWCRFLQDGTPSKPTQIETYRPPLPVNRHVRNMVQQSRLRYGKARRTVEREIGAFLSPAPRGRHR